MSSANRTIKLETRTGTEHATIWGTCIVCDTQTEENPHEITVWDSDHGEATAHICNDCAPALTEGCVYGTKAGTIDVDESKCEECGEMLAIPDRYEDVPADLETEYEHYQRTGHIPFRIPRVVACEHCEHMWGYTGGGETEASCPKCFYQTSIEDVVDLGITPE